MDGWRDRCTYVCMYVCMYVRGRYLRVSLHLLKRVSSLPTCSWRASFSLVARLTCSLWPAMCCRNASTCTRTTFTSSCFSSSCACARVRVCVLQCMCAHGAILGKHWPGAPWPPYPMRVLCIHPSIHMCTCMHRAQPSFRCAIVIEASFSCCCCRSCSACATSSMTVFLPYI